MAKNEDYTLGEIELDAIGEVMNISMGSAATAMSTMLDKKVSITTPEISHISVDEFNFDFLHPVVGVEIKYIEGINGANILIMRRADVKKIVAHLLSMDPNEIDENDEIGQSAICEIMNQMMGSSASALATFLGRSINISTPEILASVAKESVRELFEIKGDMIVSIKFKLDIEDLVESEFLSALEPGLAKEIVNISLQYNGIVQEDEIVSERDDAMAAAGTAQNPAPHTGSGPTGFQPGLQGHAQPYSDASFVQSGPTPGPVNQGDMYALPYGNPAANTGSANESGQYNQAQTPPGYPMPPGMPPGYYPYPPQGYVIQPGYHSGRVATGAYSYKSIGNDGSAGGHDNLDLVMTVPIQISVELGRTRKKIKDIADLGVGNIVELDRQAGDQVDVIANGKLIAKGDVVVVDDNYSVRITEIIKQPEEFV